MIDLENRLRSSLQERADDVEPTPELWRTVERKVARRRALPIFVWAVAGTAAAVTAVAVLPGLLDRTEGGLRIDPAGPTATSAPADDTPAGTPAAGEQGLPAAYVAVDGPRLVLRSTDGTFPDRLLVELAVEGESSFVSVSVRPGSTRDDLTVAYVTSAEGMFDVRVARYTPDGAADVTVVAGDILGGAQPAGGLRPTAVWSPDGASLAWVTVQAGRGSAAVSGRAWDGEQAAAEGFDVGLPDAVGPTDAVLQDWAAAADGTRLVLTAGGAAYDLAVVDGEPATAWQQLEVDGYVVDIDRSGDREYVLTAGGSGSRDAEDPGLVLRVATPAGEARIGVEVQTADPSGIWMTAVGDGVLLGLGDRSQLLEVTDSGAGAHELAAPMSYGSFVPDPAATTDQVGDPQPSVPTASGPLSESGVTPYLSVDETGRIRLHEGVGEVTATLFDPADEPGSNAFPMDLAVRPGSSVDDLTAVVLVATEGGPELRWLRVQDGATTFELFPGPLGIGADASYSSLQVPVWSPDGRHLAWPEQGGDGSWTLRTIGWDEGPGTGRPADDNASFGIPLQGASDVQVSEWLWEEQSAGDDAAVGAILLTVDRQGDGSAPTSYRLPITRQGDGALALAGDAALEPIDEPGLRVIDIAVSPGGLASRLVAQADGTYAVLLTSPSDEPVLLPLHDVADPRNLDLDALEHVVVVTDRMTGQSVVVDRLGGAATLEADASTTHAFDRVD